MSRFARKVDDNQRDIVRTLRAAGAVVQSLASVGSGCPDLLVGWRGRWLVVEVKGGSKAASKRRLTELEEAWHVPAHHAGLRVEVVNSTAEAVALLNSITKETR